MEKLKQSPAEDLKTVEIQTIEMEQLDRVFKILCKPNFAIKPFRQFR